MPDLRTTVEASRDIIKKIQLVIPGYRGYRLREDLRDADSLLRLQLADYLQMKVEQPVEQALERLSSSLELAQIGDIRTLRYAIKKLGARIRHAEQGYSGISPAVNVGEGELNGIYEYDAKLVDSLIAMKAGAEVLLKNADQGQFPALKESLGEITRQVRAFEELVDKRRVLHIDIFSRKGEEG